MSDDDCEGCGRSSCLAWRGLGCFNTTSSHKCHNVVGGGGGVTGRSNAHSPARPGADGDAPGSSALTHASSHHHHHHHHHQRQARVVAATVWRLPRRTSDRAAPSAPRYGGYVAVRGASSGPGRWSDAPAATRQHARRPPGRRTIGRPIRVGLQGGVLRPGRADAARALPRDITERGAARHAAPGPALTRAVGGQRGTIETPGHTRKTMAYSRKATAGRLKETER